MTDCTSCLHYDVCEEHYSKADLDYIHGSCINFEDKSEWLQLPCKPGDIVYKVWYLPCHNGKCYPDSYDCCGCLDKCDIKKDIAEFKVPNVQFILDNLMGKSYVYFLTYEEAKKAKEKR